MVVDFLATIRQECQRFSQLARTVPHDASVPHLHGWMAHDVIAHLAGDYRWAQQIITTRVKPRTGLQAARERGDALIAEWDAAAADLIQLLTFCDLTKSCPNFAQGDAGVVRWWVRHQAHETTLHRWDLESAAGTCTPIPSGLALDGIEELFTVYAERYSPFELLRPVTLGCPNHSRTWIVTPTGDGFVTLSRSVQPPPADVEASPEVLLLALWGRIELDDPRVRIHGDADHVHALFRGPLTA